MFFYILFEQGKCSGVFDSLDMAQRHFELTMFEGTRFGLVWESPVEGFWIPSFDYQLGPVEIRRKLFKGYREAFALETS